jgi:hypothetical protein
MERCSKRPHKDDTPYIMRDAVAILIADRDGRRKDAKAIRKGTICDKCLNDAIDRVRLMIAGPAAEMYRINPLMSLDDCVDNELLQMQEAMEKAGLVFPEIMKLESKASGFIAGWAAARWARRQAAGESDRQARKQVQRIRRLQQENAWLREMLPEQEL